MIPSCYIGIESDCDTCTTPSSGLFLNGPMGLPGITLKDAAAIADSETGSGLILLQNAINQALLQAKNDLKLHIRKLYRWKNTIDQSTYGEFTQDFLPLTPGENGITEISIPDWCKYARICIPFIKTQVSSGIGVNELKIIDLNTNTTVASKFVSIGSSDVITTEFNFESDSKDIAIVWDTSAITANDTDARDIFHQQRDFLSIRTDGTTYGIQPKIQVICDPELLLCDLEKEMAYAVRFRAGANFMLELLNTDKVNPPVVCKTGQAQINLDAWAGFILDGKFIPGEYQRYLDQVIESLPDIVERCNCCFECNTTQIQWADMRGSGKY